jgi:hypothetical protein
VKGQSAVHLLFISCGVALALAAGACIAYQSEIEIEVNAGSSVPVRESLAASFVTETRVSNLRRDIQRAFPGVASGDLANLYLRWATTEYRATRGPRSTRTSLIVGLRHGRSARNIPAILEFCARRLEAEVRDRERALVEKP